MSTAVGYGIHYHIIVSMFKDIPKSCVPGALNALISSTMGIVTLVSFIEVWAGKGYNEAVLFLWTVDAATEASNLTVMGYFLADVLLGAKYFHEDMLGLDGYIHHLVYTIVLGIAVWNQFFITGACLLLLMEIPQVIFYIGKLFKGYRQDLLYGISFLIFRLLLPIYVSICLIMHGDTMDYIYTVLTMFALLLHLFWFSKWIHKYLNDERYAGFAPHVDQAVSIEGLDSEHQ